MFLRKKIGLVGSGQIGSSLALLAGMKKLGDVALFDVVDGVAQGKALDLSHLAAIESFPCEYTGSTDTSVLKGCDVVIVTAGVPRKPGMKREDMIDINAKIMKSVGEAIKSYCPSAFIIVITNPLDAMVYLLHKYSGVKENMICGMAGVLDTARFKAFLAAKLNVSTADISALVLGGHGDAMVPLTNYVSVGGIPLSTYVKMGMITDAEIEAICDRTRNGGAEVVDLLKTGSAFYAPASAAIEMAESYLRDGKRIVPCAAFCTKEYDAKNLFVGVPCVIGAKGVEKILELPLDDKEKGLMKSSIAGVQKLIDYLATLK